MAVYISVGHVPEDGGKPWKHLNGACPRLLALEDRGFPKKRVRNIDHKKPLELHVRRRCPLCFEEPKGLGPLPAPKWLETAEELERSKPRPTYWVYNLSDPQRKDAQVGMATNLATRLRSRWKATCAPGFVADGIPWLHERLKANPRFEPVLEVDRFTSRADALAGEARLRERLRASGWNVSSDV